MKTQYLQRFALFFIACISITSLLHAKPSMSTSTDLIRPETSLRFTFDQAVVSQEWVNKKSPNSVINISPKWAGKILWTSTNTAEFLPDVAPKMNTSYSFSINKNLKHLDGTAIPAMQFGKYNSEPLRTNYQRVYNSLSSNRKPATYVRFNDNVKLSNINKHLYYRDAKGNKIPAYARYATWADLESSYYVKPSWQKRFENILLLRSGKKLPQATYARNTVFRNGIIVFPTKLIPIGNQWSLKVNNGILSENSKQKTTKVSTISIGDLKPFMLSNVNSSSYADSDRQVYLSFNSSLPKSTPEQLAQFIKITPQPANFSIKQSSRTTIQLSGDFYQQNNYKLTLKKGLTASNKLSVDKDVEKEIKFTYVKPGLGLSSFINSQYAKGAREYSIDTVNMKNANVKLKSLNEQQAVRLIQSYHHYTKKDDKNNRHALPYDLVTGTTILNKTFELKNKVDRTEKITFKWNELLPAESKNAILFLSVKSNAKDEVTDDIYQAQSILQLTDIGLAWKLSEEKIWVYAYSCKTGQPLNNVTINVYGDEATKLSSQKTDKDGLCMITRNKAKDRHLAASFGSDKVISALNNNIDATSMWRFPVDYSFGAGSAWKHDVMLFSDRNLYKPGETVRIKGIARERKDTQLRIPAKKTASYEIYDAQYRSFKTGIVTLTEHGNFDLTFDLPAEKVGTFSINFDFSEEEVTNNNNNKQTVFSHYFGVQEFRRNAYEITTNLPKPKPAATTAQIDITAKYYQGTPISEGKLAWFFTATPTGFYPEKFRDYHFGDHRKHDAYYWSHYFGYNDGSNYDRDAEHLNGKTKLDADGSASVKINIPKPEFPSPQAIQFLTETTDSRDQTLSKTTRALVHPASHYFGIARVDKLVRVNEALDLNFVHIDLKGNYSKLDTKATLHTQRVYSEAVKTIDKQGRQRVTNEKRIEEFPVQELTVNGDKPTIHPFKATKPGKYVLTLKGTDADGNATATASTFYVYGATDYPWANEDGIRIKLVAEKKSYKPGDTARILVMTPIEGTALVTVERAGVSRHYRRQLRADNPIIEVPVTDTDAPNAYVSVLLIRGADNSLHEHKQPALKLGICRINIESKKKQLNIALKVPGEYHRPGEYITVEGKVTDHQGNPVANAEITLFAEDEGVLAVMGYTMPKPFKHYNRTLPLGLRTGVSLGNFLAENQNYRYYGNKGFIVGDAKGGGVEMAEIGKIQAELRSNFDPCAFWAPTLKTSADGTFTLTAKSPDTLTRYRIMAAATSGVDRFGSSKSSVIVNKDIMLEPAAPRFANEGDAVTPKVLVQNTSKHSGEWDITLKTDSLALITESNSNTLTKTISLAPGESVTLNFPVKMTNTGETKWEWSATPKTLSSGAITPVLASRLSDRVETKFQVNYPRPLLKFSDNLSLNNQRLKLFAKADKRLLTGRGRAELNFSNSLLLEADGAFNYLLKYPYGCVEQTTSGMMPWLAVKDLRNISPAFKKTTDAEVLKALQKGVDRLLSMQTSSGGLAYWPNENDAEVWASSYGAYGLVMAKKAGANVPEKSLQSLFRFLNGIIVDKPIEKNSAWQNESICRSLYVLALGGEKSPALLNTFYEKRKRLNGTSRAFLALAIHHSGGDKTMATNLLTEKLPAIVVTDHWMVHRANDSIKLLALSEIDPLNPATDTTLQAILKKRNRQGHWFTTWANGWTVNGIASYVRNVESKRPDVTVTYNLNGTPQTVVLTKANPTHSISLSLVEAAQAMASSDNKAYVSAKLASKPELAPAGAESHGGLTIKRRYERITADGKAQPLTEPKVGALVRVSLDVKIGKAVSYAVIEDLLPSTMETVNGDFASQKSHVADPSKSNWSISRRELRSDRALFFINQSWSNKTQTISYLARITSAGIVHAPPAKIEAMYDPSRYALTKGEKLRSSK